MGCQGDRSISPSPRHLTGRRHSTGDARASAFIIRRILALIPTLLLIYSLTFFLMHSTPGGPWDTGEKPIPADVQERLKAAYGLDKPLWQQYTDFLGRAVQGTSESDRARHVDDPGLRQARPAIPHFSPEKADAARGGACHAAVVRTDVNAGQWSLFRRDQRREIVMSPMHLTKRRRSKHEKESLPWCNQSVVMPGRGRWPPAVLPLNWPRNGGCCCSGAFC